MAKPLPAHPRGGNPAPPGTADLASIKLPTGPAPGSAPRGQKLDQAGVAAVPPSAAEPPEPPPPRAGWRIWRPAAGDDVWGFDFGGRVLVCPRCGSLVSLQLDAPTVHIDWHLRVERGI